MPTGYTAAIKDGISFQQFAMDCARAFGACIMLRDEPGGGEKIPEEFKPSTYSQEKYDEAKLELARLEALSPPLRQDAADSEYAGEVARRLKRISDSASLKEKYLAMRDSVEAWQIPSGEHLELKVFMLNQIDESIRFDCGDPCWDEEPKKLSADAWHSAAISKKLADIAYHSKAYAEEVERTNKRNAWVKALRESL